MAKYKTRTDLAVEIKESFEKDDVEIDGVVLTEDYDEKWDIKVSVVEIKNDKGAQIMEKPVGTYLTMEIPNLIDSDSDYHNIVSKELAKYLRKIVPLNKEKKILVVGLGNRDITPDALGPEVIANLEVNRHLIQEYGKAYMGDDMCHVISTIIPGVMAQTGMETMEILKGIIKETKPDMVVAIDALAARSIHRLNCTIQITDTGINPGSGVLNRRQGLNKKTLGIPVIAIGVPTVIDAATIVCDAMEQIQAALKPEEWETFFEQLITPELYTMFVTPKDVDETIHEIGKMISEGLNLAFSYV